MEQNPLGNKHVPKTRIFEITQGWAKFKKLPRLFVAKPIIETDRAYYLYGHGTLETVSTGRCCECGRELTHPVSVKLGIGPICGKHYWDWSLVGGFSEENIERLREELGKRMLEFKIDDWFPKSKIVQTIGTQEDILIPGDHDKLKRNGGPTTAEVTERFKNNLHPPITNHQGTKTGPARRAILGHSKTADQWIIMIYFPYNVEDLDKVRSLPGRKYVPEKKLWVAPLSIENIEKLKEWGFDLDPKLIKYLEKTKVHVDNVVEAQIPGLKGELYPFQKKGVGFIEAKQGRALIGDEMGLGKTIQALAYLQLHPELRPAVIVVPASLKLNWKREAKAWMPNPDVMILSGTTHRRFTSKGIIIVNYDIVPNEYKMEIQKNKKGEKKEVEVEVSGTGWIDYILDNKPKVLITDECHYYKNNKANRTKAIKKLGKHIPHIIALSGTPIVNRPEEIINAVQLIDFNVFPNRWDFLMRYCGAKHNGYGWDFKGATNTMELNEKLTNSIMIRRKKSEVLPDLPEKVRSFIPMELSNSKEYYTAEADFISFVLEQKGAEAAERASNAQSLAEIEGLKQLAVKGKLLDCVEWIADFLESDSKLVIFATHKFVIDALMAAFKNKAVKVDGSVTGANRQKAVDDFQQDPNVRLFIGNIKAAGVGITLTASSNVAFLELPWTPGEVTQAEDRVHRIGQKDSVNIYYLLANNTIEEKIAALLDKKRRVLDAILDGKDTDDESLLTQLLNSYK